jgi:FtsZ-interacting cell division protein ZipA
MSLLHVLVPIAIVAFAVYLLWSSTMRTSEGFTDSSGEKVEHFDTSGAEVQATLEAPSASMNDSAIVTSAETFANEKPGEFHLDAGGTFLAAYKKLEPQQIASMTKDTRELIETQKQLMSTLATLKPLISDGKEMLKTFGDYFGSADMNLTK